MKKLFYFLCVIVIFLNSTSAPIIVFSENQQIDNLNFEDIYKEQFELSGADKLKKELPEQTQKDLDSIGVEDAEWKDLSKLNPQKIYNLILDKFKSKLPTLIKSILTILSMTIICSIFLSAKLSTDKKKIEKVLDFACLLSICLVMIKPIVEIILKTSNIMNSVSKFMISYIPIITGIMYATGQSLLGSSYSTVMILFSEFIMQISSKILIPILNIFLAISITSSMPTTCSFSNVCSFFSKTAKWIIGISTVVFVGILTIQSVITSAADNIGTKTLKFMLSGSVPVVGKTLGDALLVINGSVKLLKSGVGAFFLLAVGVIFIPVILDCLTFKIVSAISLNLSETFGITSASKLIKNTTEVLNLLLIIVLCCLIVLLVSTSLIILINPLNL